MPVDWPRRLATGGCERSLAGLTLSIKEHDTSRGEPHAPNGPPGEHNRLRGEDMNAQRGGTWDAADCALLLMDYQENVLAQVFEQDRRVVELNARTLATYAVALRMPVVLSTVAVEMGVNKPTIQSLQAALPDVKPIDRSQRNAWRDPVFRDAVKATGRRKLVMGGISTSVCLAYPAADALADGYEVTFIEDAVADSTKEIHDIAVLRLAHAGAVPNTTQAMMAEWDSDWKSPLADVAREIWGPYREEWASLLRAPEQHPVKGWA
jgi:nicotinamidase-related amidase